MKAICFVEDRINCFFRNVFYRIQGTNILLDLHIFTIENLFDEEKTQSLIEDFLDRHGYDNILIIKTFTSGKLNLISSEEPSKKFAYQCVDGCIYIQDAVLSKESGTLFQKFDQKNDQLLGLFNTVEEQNLINITNLEICNSRYFSWDKGSSDEYTCALLCPTLIRNGRNGVSEDQSPPSSPPSRCTSPFVERKKTLRRSFSKEDCETFSNLISPQAIVK